MSDEVGELECEAEVAAVAETVHRFAQQRAADLDPVGNRFAQRVAALAENVGKEIRIEPQFLDQPARRVGDAAQSDAVLGGSHVDVDAHLEKARQIRLHADPVVAPEHGGFLACLVRLIHQRLAEFDDELVDELHPCQITFGGHAAGGVVIPFIHEILGPQAIAMFLGEVLQRQHADGILIAGPVAEFIHRVLIGIDRKMIGERRQANDVGLRMVEQILVVEFHQMVPAFLVIGIHTDHMGLVPVVGEMVIHRGRVPDLKHEEIHGVNVERNRAGDRDQAGFRIQLPLAGWHELAGGAVDDFPIFLRRMFQIDDIFFAIEPAHRIDDQGFAGGGDRVGHQKFLRQLVHVQPRIGLLRADEAGGRIDFQAEVEHLLGQLGAIGIADGIGTPLFGELHDHGLFPDLGGQGDGTGGRGGFGGWFLGWHGGGWVDGGSLGA